MPITDELRELLAAKGSAEADERSREEDARARRERELAAHVEADARAQRDSTSNAETIWSWVMSQEAAELRQTMCRHGLARVWLGSFGIVHGECRPGPSFGACTIDVLAHGPALHVRIVRGYHGNRARVVASVVELVGLVPDRVLETVAGEVRAGRMLDIVGAALSAASQALTEPR
jgi:hypothetical protein